MTRRRDPFKSIRRGAWRRALSHNALADKSLDGLISIQSSVNAMIDKLSAVTPSTIPTDFADDKIGKIAEWGELLPATVSYRPDNSSIGHGHRQGLKWALLHALYSQELTEEFLHLIDELQEAHDDLCDKLDAQSGTLSDTDFASSVGMTILNPEKKMPSRSRASFRTWLISTMSSYNMSNDFIDSVMACQKAINDIAAELDAGGVSMPSKVSVLNPKARL